MPNAMPPTHVRLMCTATGIQASWHQTQLLSVRNPGWLMIASFVVLHHWSCIFRGCIKMGSINSKTCLHAPQTSIQHYKADNVTLDVTAPEVPSAATFA